MPVFHAFFKTARKFMSAIAIYFMIFVALALTLTTITARDNQTAFQSVALDISVIDNDHSEASEALTQYLTSLHQVTPTEDNREVLLDSLFYRTCDYILILPQDFEQHLLLGDTDSLYETMQIPGVYNSYFVDEQLDTYLKTVQLYLAGGYSLTDALTHTSDTIHASADAVHTVNFEKKDPQSAKKTSMFYFFQYVPYILFSMILCGMTPILTTFWNHDLEKRIACSALSQKSKNMQMALGSIVYCLANWILFLLVEFITYGIHIFSQEGLLCLLNSFLLLPCAAALALTIGCFSPTGNVINMINNIISLGMSFLCGIFIPQGQLSQGVLNVSKYLPFYWYIKNNNMLAGFSDESFSFASYWENCGIQLLFIITFFAIALVASKLRSSRRKA